MQTFLLDRNFTESAAMLDSRRLNKQLIECHQINQVLLGKSDGWASHPCVTMWEDYYSAFLRYTEAIAIECRVRGIGNKLIDSYKISGIIHYDNPVWLDEDFILRHKKALLFKTRLKFVVYDYSLLTSTFISDVNRTSEFNRFLQENESVTRLKVERVVQLFPIGKQIYRNKRISTIKELSSAAATYAIYCNFFGELEHKVEYRWGK